MVPEPIQNIGVLAASDRFEGYAAERTEILKYVNDNKIENVVFVAADIHGTLVNNLTYQTAPGQAQIATSAFEITTGSVGYSQPFGQTVAQLGAALGVITPQQKALYDSLPTAGKDTFIKGVVDGGLQPLGYDPLGLDKNLSQANGLIGFNDNVFTGSGNDSVDIPIAGANAGNNRVDLGSGNDVIYVANNDRSFGSTGDDIFEANDAKDYRISAGAGNDTLFLGTNGRALGGDGNDKLFVGNGGGNYLSGGAGADQFWIANVEIPGAANTIVDFQIGTDVIGIQGATSLGINATSLKLNQVGADTAINFGSQTLAVLTGMQASNLTLGNPSQFVFA
jgi:Ca2+-binding RTX toxin-like protein